MPDQTQTWTVEQYKHYLATGHKPAQFSVQQRSEADQGKDNGSGLVVDLTPEKELQRLSELELNRRGITFLHLSHKAREKVGWPDLVFAYYGVPVAIELKTKTGTLTKEQAECLAAMKNNGFRVYVLRSIENVIDVLNQIEKETR